MSEPKQKSVAGSDIAEELLARLRKIGAGSPELRDQQEGFAHPGEVIVLVQPAGLVGTGSEDEIDQALDQLLVRLREKNFLKAQSRVGQGGILTAIMRACAQVGTGFDVSLGENDGATLAEALWGESPGRALVACWSSAHLATSNFVDRSGYFTGEAIGRVTSGEVRVRWMAETVLSAHMRALGSA